MISKNKIFQVAKEALKKDWSGWANTNRLSVTDWRIFSNTRRTFIVAVKLKVPGGHTAEVFVKCNLVTGEVKPEETCQRY